MSAGPVPVYIKVIGALAGLSLCGILALGAWVKESLEERRSVHCQAWEWVVQRSSNPDEAKVIEFVHFLEDDLGCEINPVAED